MNMNEYPSKKYIKNAGLVAGLGLFLMTILAITAEFNIFQKIIVLTDPDATIANIRKNLPLLRLGILLFFIIIILDVIIAWGLYIFFSPIDKFSSLLIAWLRLVYAAIFAASLLYIFEIVYLLENPAGLVFSGESLKQQVMSSLYSFRSGWNIALIMFGVHLILAGLLVIRSTYIPKWIGGFVMLSGLGYFIDGAGKTINGGYNLDLAMYTFFGEVLLMGWLIYRGASKKDFNFVV